ncbi:MAG: glycosyltransferase family 2 protein [Candidatus Acidiferrum sp.]|jgi:GT2 family glycosyltransferase
MEMNARPLVSAVIVNWNGAEHLKICLPSLLAQSYEALEIIVVDNASTDGSESVAQEYKVRWLKLASNVGLAPALNRGAKIATGKFLLFVNNDMRFDEQFVAKLMEPLLRDEEIFATDATQFFWDGTGPGHAASRLGRAPSGRAWELELVPGLYFSQEKSERETCVFMASAACMLARRAQFESLRGFDDRLPLGYEDTEICWRAWTRGWKVVYVPQAICWHRVGSSGKSVAGARYNFRGVLTGRLLLATKLLPWRYALNTWVISMAGFAKDARRWQWKFAADRARILLHMAGLVPRLLGEKKELFKSVRRSPGKQLDLLLGLANDSSARK